MESSRDSNEEDGSVPAGKEFVPIHHLIAEAGNKAKLLELYEKAAATGNPGALLRLEWFRRQCGTGERQGGTGDSNESTGT